MKKPSWYVYRATCGLARVFFPRPRIEGLENLPDAPCIIVGNHAQMYAPVYSELYLPGDRAIWCRVEMMHLREVPAYAFGDFWSKKPAWCRWFYRLLSYAIAPLSVCVFNNAHCIGVYMDSRMMGTMRESLERLQGGTRIVIFPEHEVPHNSVVWAFQDGFVNLAHLYARRTGRSLAFVPMYTAPRLKRVVLGAPIYFDVAANPGEERRRVCEALMDAVTGLARALPKHRVVPYPNLPRRLHPCNVPDGEAPSREEHP